MSQPLPTGDFRWKDCDKIAESILEHRVLEVDLESLKELHEEHNAYPPAPERMMVQKEWMSEYQYGLGNGWCQLKRKTGSHFPQQGTLRASLPQPAALPITGYASEENPQSLML